MRIFVAGATGFIGRALCLRLQRDSHEVVAWSRSPRRARASLGAGPTIRGGDDAALVAALDGCDVVVNLAGESVLPGRWTTARKAALERSRVGFNHRIVAAMKAASRSPGAFVCASAVGFYGDGGDTLLTETSPRGQGFLAELCERWEASARTAAPARVVHMRIGIVLGRSGGALAQMLPIARAGLMGPMGSGRQYLPWIHLDDVVEALVAAIRDPRFAGPVNLVGPDPVPQAEFARALGRAVGRPAVLPAPAFAMRLGLGEAAMALLDGQRAYPARLKELGFSFRHPTLDGALAAVVAAPEGVEVRPFDGMLDMDVGLPYLRERVPTHELRATQRVPLPLDEAWAFFSEPTNVGPLSPPDFGMELDPDVVTATGARFTHHIRVGPVRVGWHGRFVTVEPGVRFVDVQDGGPWRCFWHEHRFEADGPDHTLLHDRVLLRPPAGPIGRVVFALALKSKLFELFAYRHEALRLRFGSDEARQAVA